MKRLLLSALAAGTLGCPPLTSCIAAGARVRTPAGPREIESLLPGDEVECVDPLTGARVAAQLRGVRSAPRECLRLAFDGGALRCTSDHPLFCPDSQTWAPAGDWAQGKRRRLLLVDDEEVRAVEVRVEVQPDGSCYAGVFDVYDLTVDHPLHNFVADGVLVHNKSPVLRECQLDDGGLTYEEQRCVCPDGVSDGYLVCLPDGSAVCEGCADGGAGPDAGALDDGGVNPADGGTDGAGDGGG